MQVLQVWMGGPGAEGFARVCGCDDGFEGTGRSHPLFCGGKPKRVAAVASSGPHRDDLRMHMYT